MWRGVPCSASGSRSARRSASGAVRSLAAQVPQICRQSPLPPRPQRSRPGARAGAAAARALPVLLARAPQAPWAPSPPRATANWTRRRRLRPRPRSRDWPSWSPISPAFNWTANEARRRGWRSQLVPRLGPRRPPRRPPRCRRHRRCCSRAWRAPSGPPSPVVNGSDVPSPPCSCSVCSEGVLRARADAHSPRRARSSCSPFWTRTRRSRPQTRAARAPNTAPRTTRGRSCSPASRVAIGWGWEPLVACISRGLCGTSRGNSPSRRCHCAAARPRAAQHARRPCSATCSTPPAHIRT